MNIEADVWWLDEQHPVSLDELEQVSGLTRAELLELVHCGVLPAREQQGAGYCFGAQVIAVARTASRLRQELELDMAGLSVALRLLERVHTLEEEIAHLRAQLPNS